MFTGLIEDIAQMRGKQEFGETARLTVATTLPIEEIKVGDSIAINGACLTVEKIEPEQGLLTFYTLRETLSCTNLGSLALGRRVNLERALQFKERLAGHLILGHIDGTAEIQEINRRESDIVLRIQLPEHLRLFMIEKGSIAVDGISLTIAELDADWFKINIIPHTWSQTNLQFYQPGEKVNLEADMIGKYVVRACSSQTEGDYSGPDMESLRKSGF